MPLEIVKKQSISSSAHGVGLLFEAATLVHSIPGDPDQRGCSTVSIALLHAGFAIVFRHRFDNVLFFLHARIATSDVASPCMPATGILVQPEREFGFCPICFALDTLPTL